MSAYTDLQATINRFAGLAKFTPIRIDGDIGKETGFALITTLMWIGSETSTELALRLTNTDGSFNFAQIKTSAPGLTVYLGQVANEAGAPAATVAIATKPRAAPVALNPANVMNNQNAAAASLLGLGLPNWVIYSAGAALALSVAMLIMGRKRSRIAATSRS